MSDIKTFPKRGSEAKRGTEKRGCQPLRERLAALEMISGFVDDAPSGDGLEHGKRFDGLGRHGQRISGKLYKIRIVSGSDCTDGMIPCAALGGIDGIGFEGVERRDPLIRAENAPRRGCAVGRYGWNGWHPRAAPESRHGGRREFPCARRNRRDRAARPALRRGTG